MRITQLYTYPIKSLRGVPITTSIVSPNGFPYDRRFMILKVHREDASSPSLKNMTITYFNEMSLFLQDINMPRSDDPSTAILIITFKSPEKDEKTRLEIPLLPQTSNLEIVDVNLHGSSTKAYNMGEPYNSWFSSCFGWEVMLVYLGPSLRPILGNLSPNAVDKSFAPNKSWLSSITDQIPSLTKAKSEDKEGITFADVAPYLIVTEESLHDVSSRLSEGKEMDITKFRPNIVLSGSPTAYDEDYWGGIVITANTKFEQRGRLNIEMVLTQNCARCKSLNVDYSTGKPGIDETGTILKTLMKDRRVDKGTKYSPIFGRYGFLKSMVQPTKEITVGDEVIVSKRNQERTKFDWPGLTN